MSHSSPPFGMRTRLSHNSALLVALLAVQSCGGENLECGGPFCVLPPGRPEATKLRPSSGGDQIGAPGRELPLPLEVLVTDEEDRPISDVEVGFTVDQGGGTLSVPAIRSDHLGRAQVKWTLGAEPGTQSVRATATNPSGSPLDGSPLVLIAQSVRPPAAKLLLRQAPSDIVQSGILFARQPVVSVLDANDQPVLDVSVTVAITTGGGTLSGAITVSTDPTGRATYTDLAIVGVMGPRTLAFSVAEPPLATLTATVEVGAGASAQIVGNQPLLYEGIVSSPVSPAPSVVVRDAAGNPVTGAVVAFTADRDGSVSPATVATDELGVAQVSSWTLGKTAGVRYSLSARLQSSSGDPAVFSADAKAGAAGGLRIAVQPPVTARSGTPFDRQPAVQVVDQLGNPAARAGVLIKATLFTGPSGTLQNASATSDASGRASFSGLTLTGLVGDYRLSFSAPTLAGVTSDPVSLAAGPPSGLTLVQQISPTARSRVPLSDQAVLQVRDERGNPVAQPGVAVVASIATGGGTLAGGTTVVTDDNGRAAYSDLTIVGSPGQRTLRFTSTSPDAEVITAPVTLPSVATVSILTPPPVVVVVATRLDNPVSWVLEDADGQPVADVPVVFSASPGNSVEPATATSDGSGIVQLQTWTVSQTAGEQSINLEVPDVGTTNLAIEALPGPASQLEKVSGDGQSAPANSQLPQPLVVRVVDQFENGVMGALVQWRTCDGAGDFDGGTDADGYASAFQETGPEPGTFCAMASSTGLAGSPVQFSFTVTPVGPASTSRTGTQPLGRPPAPSPARTRLTP
jgi:hypothetical protein